MAYSTGAAASLNDVYDALLTFALANGWSLVDTVSTRDKVISSPGTATNLDMIYRLTASSAAGNPFKAPYSLHVKCPHVLVRGYHKWTGGVGSREYGRLGPWLHFGEVYNGSGNQIYSRFEALPPAVPPPNLDYLDSIQVTSVFDTVWDEHAYFWSNNTLVLGPQKLSNPWQYPAASNKVSPATSGSSLSTCQQALVYDSVTNKHYVYTPVNTSVDGWKFQRYDLDTNSWTFLASPPSWPAPNGSFCLWDGGDYIYVAPGAAGTVFSRYSISGNSWTALTALPANNPSAGAINGHTKAVYIPAGVVTGVTEDVIYWAGAGTGTTVYRYDVTSNVWRTTAGTGALTSPQGLVVSTQIAWDHEKYLYLCTTSTGSYYRSNLNTAPNTFSSLGTIGISGFQGEGGGHVINSFICKGRGSNSITSKYWLFGNADRIVLVTRIGAAGTGKYYWMYFGKYNSIYRSAITATTGSASAGALVTINVVSTTGLSAGDSVALFDQSTGTFERTVIYSIEGATSFKATLVNSYTTGTHVGVDPTPYCVTSDNALAGLPLDTGGYYTDQQYPWAMVRPINSEVESLDPSKRGNYAPRPLVLWNNFTTYAGVPLNSFDVYGVLDKVYALSMGAWPNPQAEDVLNLAGTSYMYFPVETNKLNANCDYGIVIGPTA